MDNQVTTFEEIEQMEPGKSHVDVVRLSVFSHEGSIPGKMAVILHRYAVIVTIPSMTILICTEVMMRYFLGMGLTWSQELCCVMLFTLVLCCQANCWQKDHHIRMDLLYNLLPTWFRKISDMLTVICGGTFYGTIVYQAIQELPYQVSIKESTDELHIPLYFLNGIIIISCGVLIILLVRHLMYIFVAKKENNS